MARILKNNFWVLGLLFALAGCRDPFEPVIEGGASSLLVVEGYIDAGPEAVTTIILSRTFKLTGSVSHVQETGAVVSIEGENELTYSLSETGNGVYTSAALTLPQNQKYRLRIKTGNGEEYASEFTPVKVTPAIDKVFWKWDTDGIKIYVSSHDPQNATTYYKWTYEETWQITSRFYSIYKYENGTLVLRDEQETNAMKNCWRSSSFTDILIGSSAKFSKDTISAPLVTLGHLSDKIGTKYSILVKQRALSKEEFQFLEIMKKNSSGMGSFFDPQPSEIVGNIKGVTHPEKLVVGYVGAYTTDNRRIFITREELPAVGGDRCEEETITDLDPDVFEAIFGDGAILPTTADFEIINNVSVLVSYKGAPAYCVDCRLRGSSEKPSFWE
ncbi:DUF4249 domain-containing protein [Rufibacter roseus]|uniref:DUF4249 domain-containing protein n=1 Tax=Rufibacter roseus TaxID=1567108 RepID=A0ABW2DMV3_9BACT|nr:DUF4249 domain-containing protein [Rufibacter roseus]